MSVLARCLVHRTQLVSTRASSNLEAQLHRRFHSATPGEEGPGPRRPVTEELIYPEPPASNHRDLPTFLQYAERSGLDTKSTTFVGTHFEYVVANSLTELGFSLRRIGGSSDCGIDLLGTWSVPSSDKPLRVLVQCKSVQRPGPHLIRELEGAFIGAPPGWRRSGVLGLLATEKPATKGIRDALGRSRWPMGFISCSRTGQLQQLLWNHRAEQEGLEGMGVGLKYPRDGGERQLALMWQGKHLPQLEEAPDG
ncbi:hypothetical protein QBC33DRAFT_87266 [Phialemonium atrogriseum]|uniref:Required for respiratory growth protein 7, mitochondrial n=1 Tax=Phialemonium atrogriseum TaxID=1093897 RepID=A0AAJ0BYP8_9PEZI|nr:uncharacterized protein QBC33DRAFT_87266 [Phialemonium atrogriseum]KAK1766750.1 hypothetical protein QBC33DRAFT_87266 [Phialemonium atrogriseum]